MDFFASQEQARRNTGRLVVLYILAVLAIIALVYVALVTVMVYLSSRHEEGAPVDFWNPQLLFWIGGGTIVLVAGATAIKIMELASGGGVVARALGGRLLNVGTSDDTERKVLNVVEEMAIASGMPVPEVYLLDRESRINAFAAGNTVENAVIGVTRGCAEQLSRDELQGVMAHEFSHILHGDMRLNVRLIGVLHGILVIGLLGSILMRTGAYTSSSRSKDNPGIALLVAGIALLIIGSLGTLFGRLIQAAVSRQREFLADASAVAFTRQPEGIAGALKNRRRDHGRARGVRRGVRNAPSSRSDLGRPARDGAIAARAARRPRGRRLRGRAGLRRAQAARAGGRGDVATVARAPDRGRPVARRGVPAHAPRGHGRHGTAVSSPG